MAIFTFSCFKSYYYLLIFWVLDISVTVIKDIFLDQEISDIEYIKGTELIYISCLTVADLLSGFLVLYTERKTKTEENEKEKEKSRKYKSKNKKKIKITYDLIYNDKSIRKHKYYYLFFISI